MSAVWWSRDRLGIIGAGELGLCLARLALEHGYKVMVANTGTASQLKVSLRTEAPKVRAGDVQDVANFASKIVLALPMEEFRNLRRDQFDDKILIDAMNAPRQDADEYVTYPGGTSMMVQDWFTDAHVVKTFNHFSSREMETLACRKGHKDRRAMAAVSDDPWALDRVRKLINNLGFDPVSAGRLSAGTLLQPGGAAHGAAHDKKRLAELVNEAWTTAA